MKLKPATIRFEDRLKAKGHRYRLHQPGSEQNKNITSFLKDNFPISYWGRVEWKKVKDSKHYLVRNDQGGVKCIKWLCKRLKLKVKSVSYGLMQVHLPLLFH